MSKFASAKLAMDIIEHHPATAHDPSTGQFSGSSAKTDHEKAAKEHGHQAAKLTAKFHQASNPKDKIAISTAATAHKQAEEHHMRAAARHSGKPIGWNKDGSFAAKPRDVNLPPGRATATAKAASAKANNLSRRLV